jgi:putative ABC transport system permease protein
VASQPGRSHRAASARVFMLSRIGLRHHRNRPSRLLLTITGIAGGVALLFATMGLNWTLRSSIERSAIGLSGTADLEVRSLAPGGLHGGDQQAITTVPGVEIVVPVVQATTQLDYGGSSERVVVLGVPPSLKALFPEGLGSAGRQISSLPTSNATLLGPSLVQHLGIGDESPPHLVTATRSLHLTHTETLETSPFDDLNAGKFVVMSPQTASAALARRGRLDVLYLTLRESASHAMVRKTITRRLDGRAIVTTPHAQAQAYEGTFDSLAQLTEFGAAASLWVAMFVVFNTMSMSLLERRRELALLSTLGAGRAQIATAFMAEALTLGIIGCSLGILAGYGLGTSLLARAADAYPFLAIPAPRSLNVDFDLIVRTFCASVAVALLGTAVPARQILKAQPIDGLSLDSSQEWAHARRERRLGGKARILSLLLCVISFLCIRGFASSDPGDLTFALLIGATLTGLLLALPPVVLASARAVRSLLRPISGSIGALATASLVRNHGRTTTTIGILAICAGLVIALGTALGSFETSVLRVFNNRYGPPLYVTAATYSGFTSDEPLPGRTAHILKQVKGVRSIYPMRYLPLNIGGRQALVVSAPMVRQAQDGYTNAIVDTRGVSRAKLISGLREGGIVPSSYTAAFHQIQVGTRFALPGVPRPLQVIGIYEDLLSIETMYTEHRTYVELSGDHSVDRFAIDPRPGIPIQALSTRLERAVSTRDIPAVVESRDQLVAAVLGSVRRLLSITRAIQLASLLIALLVVANAMLTTVAERRWESALCRAMGMSRFQMRAKLLLEAGIIGVIGALIAGAVGLGVGQLMLDLMRSRFQWQIELQLQWPILALSLPAVVLTSFLAALIPTFLAGRGGPIPILKSS